jgi:hypothetical protein
MSLHPDFPTSPCAELNPAQRWFPAAEEDGQRYDFVFVDEASWKQHTPQDFASLAAGFREYKD